MSKIKTFHVGQRYFFGEIIVDERDIYSQTDCYTTLEEALDDLECLAQECETDINRNGDRAIEAMVRQYEIKLLDDDGTVSEVENVGPAVELVKDMPSARPEAAAEAAGSKSAWEGRSRSDGPGIAASDEVVRKRYDEARTLLKRCTNAFYRDGYEDGEAICDVMLAALHWLSYEELEEEIFGK